MSENKDGGSSDRIEGTETVESVVSAEPENVLVARHHNKRLKQYYKMRSQSGEPHVYIWERGEI